MSIRSIIFILILIFLPGGLGAQDGKLRNKTQSIQSIPDIEWDAAFARTEGWTGGDAAGTVDLGDGRTLWMFADSWIGGVAEGKHAPGSHMINNAIAIHDSSSLGKCRAPHYRDISFYWGPDDDQNKPTAWIVPEDNPEKEWYWSNGSGVVIPGPYGNNRLVVFLFKLTSRGEEGSVWNFKATACAMAIIDNLSEPAEKWKVKQVQIPYSYNHDPIGGDSIMRITNWGVSTYLPNELNSGDKERKLYLYGLDDTNPADKHLLLARVGVLDIDKPERWEYFTDEKTWSSEMNDAGSIAGGLVSEISVDALYKNGQRVLILVQSEPFFGRRILVRTATDPEGPWSEPIPVYTIPGLDRGKEYFTYAAKGHLHLSCPGELLVTYIINSTNFWEMAGDAFIYRPRFVRVPLELILEQ